ncbi:AAA family ATPase [Oscillibacter sp. GMB15532]|uniref:AAA family ATPase n=1 Tax=Oscillibacter sp. GMB15532 TaxID=3230022 RepID=UPI0034DF5AB7
MPTLTAKLFGTPSVCIDGREITLPYKKADALLYYLLVKRKVSRSELIGLLWADTDISTAQKNLRHAIYSIRKALNCDPFVWGQRTLLAFNSQTTVSCDVLDFTERGDLLAYRGELLKDFSILRANAFDEWLSDERNLLQSQYLQRLLTAEKEAYFSGDLAQAEKYGQDYVSADPLEETAVLTLMQVYSAQKKFRKAIGLYHALCKSLSEALSISPLKETTALYYKIVDEWNASTYKIDDQSDQQLFGKDSVLRRLLMLCNGSRSERRKPGLLIQGTAGAGKTYLLDYVLRQYDFSDWLVCRVSCYQSEMRTALAPWNSVMLELMSEIKPWSIQIPEIYMKTATSLFPCLCLEYWQAYATTVGDYPAETDYHVAQECTLLIFSIIAKKLPLLLVFEDIHWMDANSAEMLLLFLRRLCNQDATVICTSRDACPPHIQRMLETAQMDKLMESCTMYNFNWEDTKNFVNHYIPERSTPELVDEIYQITEGNGLLLVQLVNSMQETADSGYIPGDPSSIIISRLANLTVDESKVLDAISVFPDWASFDILTSILTKDPLELMYLCNQLKQKALLTEFTRNNMLGYAFSHEKIKGILAQQQSESSRRILHLRVAQYLETQINNDQHEPYEQLIHHYTVGGNRYKAFKYKVLSLGAFAGMCYELLPILTSDTEFPAFDEEGIMGYFQVLETELASLRAIGFTTDTKELDWLERNLLYTEGRYCIHNGTYDRGLEVLERLLERSEAAEDREMSIKAHMQFIYYSIQTYNFDLMKSHLEFGMRYQEIMENTPSWGSYLRLSGLLELMRGNYGECRRWMEQSIAAFKTLDSTPAGKYDINIAGAYNYIGESYRLEQNYKEAFRYFDQAVIFNRGRGYYPGAAIFYTDYGVAAYQSGKKAESRLFFEYAEELYQSFHEYSQFPIALSYLALFDAEEGRYAEAAARLKKAFDLCKTLGSPWWMGITIYNSWKIRSLLEDAGLSIPELESFWPKSKQEHCVWSLKYLHQLEPRIETAEMERTLQTLS